MTLRIRTKLALSLLVVMLIPLVPTYYLVQGLVNRTFELAFNTSLQTAIQGATQLSSMLYKRYREDTLAQAVELAASDPVAALAGRGGSAADSAAVAALLAGLGTFVVDVYDAGNQLVATFAAGTMDADSTAQDSAVALVAAVADSMAVAAADVGLGARLADEAFAQLLAASRENPLAAVRQRVPELSAAERAAAIRGHSDPLYVSVIAPVVVAGQRAGSLLLVRQTDREFARSARHVVAVNRLFNTLDYYKDHIRRGFVVGAALFCTLMAMLAMGVGLVFARRITAPLLRVVDGTQRVAAGDLEYRIAGSAGDEIGRLIAAFNSMVEAIQENQQRAAEQARERRAAEAETQRRQRELEVSELRARALQAENERKTVELQKSQELERAYAELEESHRQLQEAQARLILQEKMVSLGSMVAGVAHEINNPMGAVRSAVDTAERCLRRLEEAVPAADTGRMLHILRQNVQVVRQAEQRITALVGHLRSFARLDEAEFQAADVRQGLDSALRLLEAQLTPDIVVHREYGDVPPLYCSPGQLNQAFMSVLRNAVEALHGRGELRVATWHDATHLHVRISDTGVGIAAERLRRIFDLHFSTSSTRVRLGSGLSLTYRIVQAHEGEIDIQSTPGAGTQVTISLPLRRGPGDAGTAPSQS